MSRTGLRNADRTFHQRVSARHNYCTRARASWTGMTMRDASRIIIVVLLSLKAYVRLRICRNVRGAAKTFATTPSIVVSVAQDSGIMVRHYWVKNAAPVPAIYGGSVGVVV